MKAYPEGAEVESLTAQLAVALAAARLEGADAARRELLDGHMRCWMGTVAREYIESRIGKEPEPK